MPPIFNTSQIVNLVDMMVVINTIKIIILIITKTIIIAVNYRKTSVMFVTKKIIALISIQKMSNKRQKNFRDKIGNFAEIKANIIHF